MRVSPHLLMFYLFFLAVSAVMGVEKISPPPLLAITDLRTVGGEDSTAEAKAFSEFIRKEIDKTGFYRVISQSSMMSILQSNSFKLPCHELACFVQMGKLLGADLVLAGYLQRQGELLEITLRVIDVKNSRFKKTVYQTASNLKADQLFGDWGLKVIYDAFDVDKSQIKTASSEEMSSGMEPEIPAEVKNKYPGMIFIPAGDVFIGSNDGDLCEQPRHKVFANAFYIGKFEVTNKEYLEFVKATGHRAPSHWSGTVIPPGLDSHPVEWVSYEDAETYCTWRGGRLPSEAEWERAARSNQLLLYPWGNKFDTNRANTWEANRNGTAAVGSYPMGASPFGVEDMAGNVFEWVSGFLEAYPGSKVKLPEYNQHLRILRGGSWNFNDYYARTTHRFARSGGERSRCYGFRLAKD